MAAWCLTADPTWRVVVAGYDGDYPNLEAAGWTVHQSKATNGGGYNNQTANRDDDWTNNATRERLWASPACVGHHQPTLLDEVAP